MLTNRDENKFCAEINVCVYRNFLVSLFQLMKDGTSTLHVVSYFCSVYITDKWTSKNLPPLLEFFFAIADCSLQCILCISRLGLCAGLRFVLIVRLLLIGY